MRNQRQKQKLKLEKTTDKRNISFFKKSTQKKTKNSKKYSIWGKFASGKKSKTGSRIKFQIKIEQIFWARCHWFICCLIDLSFCLRGGFIHSIQVVPLQGERSTRAKYLRCHKLVIWKRKKLHDAPLKINNICTSIYTYTCIQVYVHTSVHTYITFIHISTDVCTHSWI